MLSVVLANHAIKLLTSLFQDLQVEALHKVSKAELCGLPPRLPRSLKINRGGSADLCSLLWLPAPGLGDGRAPSSAQHHGPEHVHPADSEAD